MCDGCEQSYFGSSRTGHLEPKMFECVSCHRSLDMDAMAIKPAEGFVGSHMLKQVTPWNPDRGNLLKRWFLMIGASLGSPIRLAQGLPPNRGLGIGIRFLLINTVLFGMIMSLPFVIVSGLLVGAQNISQGFVVFLGYLGGFTISVMVIAFITGVLSHLILGLTGKHKGGLSVTLASLMVTSGPMCVLSVPCFFIYASPFILVWWLVNFTLALRTLHDLSTIRAVTSAFGPFLLYILGLVLWMILIS